MPKVAFLIPGSPSQAFLSQVAAFRLALGRLRWTRWEPSVTACLGGTPDIAAFDRWAPHLAEVATLLVPAAEVAATPHHYAQIDALYRWAPRDADVLVRLDADTIPVDDLEDVLDHVAEEGCIAGVIAHYAFPGWRGLTARQAWLRVAQGLVEAPLDFAHAYTLADRRAPPDEIATPFYLNDGVVFLARAAFEHFAPSYLRLRPRLMDRLPLPYFAGQVALALAVAETGIPASALPPRYNLPNDDLALALFPAEVEAACIVHYLRTERFDRQRIFADAAGWDAFMAAPLDGVDAAFRDMLRRRLGEAYPFAPPVGRAP
jgi:hypothetical protein